LLAAVAFLLFVFPWCLGGKSKIAFHHQAAVFVFKRWRAIFRVAIEFVL
jgi:hypothetical protein